jgi:hypothetical protein
MQSSLACGSPVSFVHTPVCSTLLEVKFAARVLGGEETRSLEDFFKQKFGNAAFRIKRPPKKRDSFEVYVGEEFIGVVYIEGEGQNRSYVLEMAILEMDLTEEPG